MSIRLRELFACTEQGGAFVAESADGRLLHIGEVPSGLACNCVCPGTVDTPSLHDRINALGDPVEARKMFVARQPMGRLAKAEEIAPVVVFLASEASSYITGHNLMVDGGLTAW